MIPKCGCRFYEDAQWSWNDVQELCPLHAAASDMLTFIKDYIKAIPEDDDLEVRAKTLVAKAEGERL